MEHVLIIENDPEQMKKLVAALEGEYRISTSKTQQEAFKLLQHKLPDLILMEEGSPDVCVLKIIEYVKRVDELSGIPMIVLSDGEDEEFEKKCIHLGATDFIFRPCSAVGIRSRVQRVCKIEQIIRNLRSDMYEKCAVIDEMNDMVHRDPLTKLFNRSYAEEQINAYLCERRNRGTLLMIDMDNFKQINDSFGHIVGDEILVEFANTLKALTRRDDVVCRLGGDEFIIFLKNVSSHAMIIEKVEQIIVTLEKRLVKPDGGNITVSTGIAVSPSDGRSFTHLYQNADKSLYFVKQNSKGSYHFFSEEGADGAGHISKKNTQVDLEHLRSFIQEVGYNKGAYQVEYDGFKKIYRFIARCIGRTNQKVQTVLFTLRNTERTPLDVQELFYAMDNLKNAVNESIRRSDVATNYSSSQYVVILMDSSIEDANMVANRICEKYKDLGNCNPNVKLEFDIQTVCTAPSNWGDCD